MRQGHVCTRHRPRPGSHARLLRPCDGAAVPSARSGDDLDLRRTRWGPLPNRPEARMHAGGGGPPARHRLWLGTGFALPSSSTATPGRHPASRPGRSRGPAGMLPQGESRSMQACGRAGRLHPGPVHGQIAVNSFRRGSSISARVKQVRPFPPQRSGLSPVSCISPLRSPSGQNRTGLDAHRRRAISPVKQGVHDVDHCRAQAEALIKAEYATKAGDTGSPKSRWRSSRNAFPT